MTVINQMKSDLLKYPQFIKNKWSCYHQWFAISGNGMEWVNGELVDVDTPNEPILNINDAIDLLFEKRFDGVIDNLRNYTSNVYECGGNDMLVLDILSDQISSIENNENSFKNKIKMIMSVNDRMNDFSQGEEFFPLTKESIIANLPENGINDDWKNACIEFYLWLKENYSNLDEQSKTIIDSINTSWILEVSVAKAF